MIDILVGLWVVAVVYFLSATISHFTDVNYFGGFTLLAAVVFAVFLLWMVGGALTFVVEVWP